MEKQLNKILDFYKSDPLYDNKENILENVYFQAINDCLQKSYEWATKQK